MPHTSTPPWHAALPLCGALFIPPTLTGATAGDARSVFAAQLAIYAKVTSARFDEEVLTRDPAGTPIQYRVHYVVKGPFYKVTRLDGPAAGAETPSLTYTANADGWQYLEGQRELCLLHKGAEKEGFGDVPLGASLPTPLVLEPFHFLGYHDHIATTSLSVAWSLIADPAWLDERLRDTVATIDVEAAGDTVVHVPHTSAKRISDQEFIEVVQDCEARYVLHAYPEFAGARLVTDIQWCRVGLPTDNHARITYRPFTGQDGSGPFPLPCEIVETDEKNTVTASRKLTRVVLNAPIDDSEFELDPTKVRTIHDFSNQGGIVPVRGEGAADPPR